MQWGQAVALCNLGAGGRVHSDRVHPMYLAASGTPGHIECNWVGLSWGWGFTVGHSFLMKNASPISPLYFLPPFTFLKWIAGVRTGETGPPTIILYYIVYNFAIINSADGGLFSH